MLKTIAIGLGAGFVAFTLLSFCSESYPSGITVPVKRVPLPRHRPYNLDEEHTRLLQYLRGLQ